MTDSNQTRIEPGDLLTIPEVAALLRVQPSTIRAWLTQERLARVKVGRLTRIVRTSVDAFLCAGRVRGNEPMETRKGKPEEPADDQPI